MTLDYFYCKPETIIGDVVSIEGDEFIHLTHVLRKRVGELIRVVDGRGTAYDVELASLKKKVVEGKIVARYVHHNESENHVSLAVGLLKNPSRFDFLIEKVTELGVKEIIPITTSRTIPTHAKTERWQKLALSGMKQSCRSFLPVVRETMALQEFLLESNRYNQKLLFHEKATSLFSQTGINVSEVNAAIILIGPEGGFSDEEAEQCLQQGYEMYSLGKRRLRTETSAIVAAAMVLISR